MYHDPEQFPTLVTPEVPTAVVRWGGGGPHIVRRQEAAPATPVLPAVGTSFLGFKLLALLGRGAFGQVYLAEQADLANRYVALKVGRDLFGESQTLAQLQHTNIMPIYSLHRVEPFQAVCMPYFGTTTLADILGQTQRQPTRPTTGKVLVDTVNDRKRVTAAHGAVPAVLPAPADTVGVSRKGTGILHQLEHMSYVDAVLWLGERLADGLAHAHERGILHLDLKPANILLTEEGQPMLLDFNISQDLKRHDPSAAVAGGTLPYMSPEHLDAIRECMHPLDGRTDVYAFGIILHELLAGRLPYKTCSRFTPDAIATMIAERRQPPPPLESANPAVSPAVASIVARCLEAEPAHRYQSARELQEDLRRQRSDLPLRYAREPSIRERATKWARRHPRLMSTTSVAVTLGVFLVLLGATLVLRSRQLAQHEAQATLRQFREDARSVQFLLYSRNADRCRLAEGMDRARATLAHFAILDDPQWQEAPRVTHLPEPEQASLRDEAGEVLFLLARATALHAQTYAEPACRANQLYGALCLNIFTEEVLGTDHIPRALWEQRADLATLLDDPHGASKATAKAQATPLRTPRDRYLIAHQYAIHGNLRDALAILQAVTEEDPQSFPAWFVRGNCCYDLAQDANAVASFNVCVALRPDFPWLWFNRGLAHLRLKQYRRAQADFAQVLRHKAELTEGHVCLALALEGQEAHAEAIAEYTAALRDPAASTRIYFLRAAARTRAGDLAGARRDYDQGLGAAPTDEQGWTARGAARRDRDPKGALADYDEALKLNPRSFDGLQNKAALLADKFHNDEAALAVMEQAVAIYPESVLARGGRGVLLARAGKRPAAIEDAQACLLLDSGPATHYQVACIYALTAKQNPDDRLQALPLLSAALRAGFGLEFVDRDTDLHTLRPVPEFARLIAAARALHTRPAAPQP
jgi:serine/threonine protein kinase/tetratricopeptide (TPR) repeat protein